MKPGTNIVRNSMFIYLVGLWLLLFTNTARSAEEFELYSQIFADTEEAALELAVISTTREALKDLIGDVVWNEKLNACMESWIVNDLEAPDYRNLVINVLRDINREVNGRWSLEASVFLDKGFLDNWFRSVQTDSDCSQPMRQRRTVYVQIPPGADTVVRRAKVSIEEALRDSPWIVRDESRRQSAQFRVNIESITDSTNGPAKSRSLNGDVVDNRIENGPVYALLNIIVSGYSRSTPEVLENDLSTSLGTAVLADMDMLSYTFGDDIELIFLSKQSSEAVAEYFVEELVDYFELPQEFADSLNSWDISPRLNGIVELSVVIPSEYDIVLDRQIRSELEEMTIDNLGFSVVVSEFSNNGNTLTIMDASAKD